ncbi:MAG TPA: hydroxymethylbilane synthase [Tepidisphaeraceae bacterium]|nr:hydroxymethylbilane synthase [Tepidisphaeraceae bacterium]
MGTPENRPIRLGTRGSLLAVRQSRQIADQLMGAHSGLRVELVTIQTTGDRITDRPLHELGGKGLFTKELQLALLSGEIDFAVHSMKDVPVTMPLVDDAPLRIAAIARRADPRDALIVRPDASARDLGAFSRIGTAQVLAIHPDARIESLRGNIDTRLRKLREGEFDAILLATAGLLRAGLWDDRTMRALPVEQFTPAPAQGALGLECRRNDARTVTLLQALDHAETRHCVMLEREIIRLLNGDCHSPIGAYAAIETDAITLHLAVGESGGGLPVRRAMVRGAIDDNTLPARAVASLA